MVTKGRRARQRDAGGGRHWATLGVIIPVLALAAVVAVVIGAVMLSASTDDGVATTCPPTAPGQRVVHGSIQQIYVTDAIPGAEVRVAGPSGFTASDRTDAHGGLLFRDVPAGGPYTVSVAGDRSSPEPVQVLAPGRPPDQAFYDSQHLTFDRTGVDRTDGYITTRDCTQLSYRVQLPSSPKPKHGYPTVITYSGYAPGVRPGDPWDRTAFDAFTKLGYAVVGVNMRGTGCSGGAFDLMEPLVSQDGYDVVETIAAQDWVGKVGMVDKSWPGLSQLFVAATRPPHLAAIVPGAPVADFYRDVVYPGGIENTGFGTFWARLRDATNAFPSADPVVGDITNDTHVVHGSPDDASCVAHQTLRGQNRNTVQAWASHPFYERVPATGPPSAADVEYNSYWSERTAAVERITVPTLLVDSWQDEQVGSRSAEVMARFNPATPVRLVGTNGGHEAYYKGRIWHYVTEFLCVYLRDDCPESVTRYQAERPVRILDETNASGEPRQEFSLPKLEFGSEGTRWKLGPDLHPDAPDKAVVPLASSFTYAPKSSRWNGAGQDQVTFTTARLNADVVMAGSGSADLWIAAANSDVDLQVTLSEVRTDGRDQFVESGWLRASHREESSDSGISTPLRPFQTHNEDARQMLTPDHPTEMRVELNPFAHVFPAGSKIR